ncbi:MAG TPA: PAS domain S-box protein, partial [Dongiaceae bacterium]
MSSLTAGRSGSQFLSPHAVARGAAILAAVVALAVFAGWIGDMPALKSVFPGYATMKPNTALSILLAAISLWLATSDGADDRPSAAHRIPALAAAAIAGLTLVEYASGFDLHIDQLLFADSDPLSLPHPGRMSAPTALCLAMFGIAMSLPRRSEPSINAAFGALYALAIVICLLALVGFLYGAPALYRPRPNMSIAIHTAVTLLILMIGATATRPDMGFYALVTSPSTGGMIARRLLPAVIALPLILGWIVLRVHEIELFDEATAIGLIAFVSTAALTAVVWFTCQRLLNIDRDHRESGAALRATEAVFTSFAQNAPVAMYMKDINGAYIFHNSEGERVYGLLDNALRGKTARDIHTADEAAEIEALDRQVIDSGKPVTAERHNARLPDYEWVSITKFPVRDHSGQIVGIGGFDIDITKERRGAAALRASEESLRTSEARYRHVVDLIHEAIWIHHEGKILFANPAAAELFGAPSADALVGKSIFSLLHPDDRELAQDRT